MAVEHETIRRRALAANRNHDEIRMLNSDELRVPTGFELVPSIAVDEW